MSGFEWLEDLIKKEIPDAHIEVTDLTGTRDHLGILVASDIFKGKLLIDQHQILMNILKEELKQRIHAVKLQTLTKEKFEQTKG
ncbi:MAG: BolA family protein [Bacteriovoracaceae bacterium]